MQVDVQRKGEAMFGLEWEARVIERFCRQDIYKYKHFLILFIQLGTRLMVLMAGASRNGSTDIRRETRIKYQVSRFFRFLAIFNKDTYYSAVNSIFIIYHGYLKHIFSYIN